VILIKNKRAATMKLPNQATPVFRTATALIKFRTATDLIKFRTATDLIKGREEQPFTVIDFTHATNKLELSLNLVAGANYNAPMRFLPPVDSCGCHILSGSSMAMCLAACGLL
jgi:hypothetical protein